MRPGRGVGVCLQRGAAGQRRAIASVVVGPTERVRCSRYPHSQTRFRSGGTCQHLRNIHTNTGYNCSDHIDYHANYEDISSATINEFREVGVRWPYRCSRIRTPEVCTFQCFYCNVTLTFQVHVI